MTAHLAVLEELANGLQRTSDSAYVAYIERMRTEDCLGVVAKIESGKITEETIAAFLEAGRLLGLHQARSNAATELRDAIALMRAPVGDAECVACDLRGSPKCSCCGREIGPVSSECHFIPGESGDLACSLAVAAEWDKREDYIKELQAQIKERE